MKIVTYYDPPPIPIRKFDWRALDYDTYEPGRPIGYGHTEEEARADLEEQMRLDRAGCEFGWVIERGDSKPHAPTYWSGPDSWSQDHMDAVRFARKQDAERVACRLGQGYHRVCEHGWGS